MSLETITRRMQEKAAEGMGPLTGKSVVFDFGEEGVVRVDGAASPPDVSNSDAAADCRVKVGMADFKDIVAGRQSPQAAFMTGRLKVEGDMGLALQLGSLLG